LDAVGHVGVVVVLTGPEQHAATITKALLAKPTNPTALRWDAMGALDKLTRRCVAAEERASRLEREREEFRGGWANEAGLTEQERARAERAEERASQLEHERDEAQQDRSEYIDIAERIGGELEQARREADQLRAALETLANPDGIVRSGDMTATRIPPHGFARAVLAGDGGGA